jgi:hypothetical protein
MNIGTAFILSMERDGRPVTDINSLDVFPNANHCAATLVLLFSSARNALCIFLAVPRRQGSTMAGLYGLPVAA